MIRILLVDDHAILRAGIRALLQFHDDVEVVAEAADGIEALRQAQVHQPDVILMDIGLPGMDGLAATRQIVSDQPRARVLILTQHENREYVIPALKSGAAGYVLKRAPDDTLLRAIRAVHAGGAYLDPDVTSVLMNDVRQGKAAPSQPCALLTEREREVLVLLAQGCTYQEAAGTLFVSVKTVDFHRANLMRKLGLENRSELTRFALEHQLI
jgi:DNA-binding NarL/FixJ family response regulator